MSFPIVMAAKFIKDVVSFVASYLIGPKRGPNRVKK